MSTKFTPGPWVANIETASSTWSGHAMESSIFGPNHELIADINPNYAETPDCWQSNAHLIAAAPDLYEALENLLDDYKCSASEWLGDSRAQADLLISYADAAIKKARGEA